MAKVGGTYVALASGQTSATGIAVDSNSVYWADGFSGEIRKVPIAGGTYVTLFSGQLNPHRIVIDGATLYWTSDSGLYKGAISGGAPVTLYGSGAHSIKVDAASIYFTTSNYKALMRLAK